VVKNASFNTGASPLPPPGPDPRPIRGRLSPGRCGGGAPCSCWTQGSRGFGRGT
jgi:hypothetical protein